MIPDDSETPDTSATTTPEAVAVPSASAAPVAVVSDAEAVDAAAVDEAAVASEARVASPPLATLTVVMPVTPTVIAPLPTEPTSPIQVMPPGSDHTVLQSTDTALGADSVCGDQSATSLSVCRVQPPLSPVSVLASSSSDVCIVAVEITPVKHRSVNRPDGRIHSLEAGGATLPHTIKVDVDGSENDDEFSRAATSDNASRHIVESDCFVDSLPTLQMLTLKAMNESDASLSSPSHSDIVPPATVRETNILTSSNHPIVIVDSSDSETSMPAIDSINSIQSKQSSSDKTSKKNHVITSESARPSVSSSQGVCKPVVGETRWVKVGRSTAAQAIAGPSTQNSGAASSGNASTAGLAGKRRIIEVTPVNDANSKAPPSKKVCTRKYAAAPIIAVSAKSANRFTNSNSAGVVSNCPVRNVVIVPKTSRLKPTPEAVVTSRSTVILSEKDLRSVVVSLHNENVVKQSDWSASESGRNKCEGDNQRVSGVGKSSVVSRRGRTESQASTRGGGVSGRGGLSGTGGVSDRGGVSERDSRKDCGDANGRSSSSSRSERDTDSRHGSSSRRALGLVKSESFGARSSSSKEGHDMRSRSSVDESHDRGDSHKVCMYMVYLTL